MNDTQQSAIRVSVDDGTSDPSSDQQPSSMLPNKEPFVAELVPYYTVSQKKGTPTLSTVTLKPINGF